MLLGVNLPQVTNEAFMCPIDGKQAIVCFLALSQDFIFL
jgi:hypothetical protein